MVTHMNPVRDTNSEPGLLVLWTPLLQKISFDKLVIIQQKVEHDTSSKIK